MDNEFILNKVNDIFDEIVNIRRSLHMCPELGNEENDTNIYIKKFLDDNNIEYFNVLETGIVAIIKNKNGKTVATRADIDALPILEENEIEYKSKNIGKMHACGHDAHMAIQLAVAKFLNENKDKWAGTIKFIFQPAEETDGGALRMINENVLKNPTVDAIFALHVAPELEVGKIGIKYGKMHASSAWFTINIKGISSHGALPHNGVDAILISSKVVEYLQSIISRKIDPREEAVITVGTINGGKAGNIICDNVEMKGTIRAVSQEVRRQIINYMNNDLPLFVKSLGGSIDIEVFIGYDSVINNDEMTKLVSENVTSLFGREALSVIEKPRLDVEDFSYFLQNVKGTFFRLGVRNIEKNTIYELHHPKFNIDEESLRIGVALQIKNIIEILK